MAVFLELPSLRDKAIGNTDNLTFKDRFASRGCVINTLFKPRIEAFEWFIGIIGLLELSVILR